MQQRDVLIKWTGSKRPDADRILRHFPSEIWTYYEPFVGGGSMLFTLLSEGSRGFSDSITVREFQCSDINRPLIELWQMIRDDPESLMSFYTKRWPFNKADFEKLRDEFNADGDPRKFFCLTRTSNGFLRYNLNGKINSSTFQCRSGVEPDRLRPTLFDWSRKVRDVQFSVSDYREIYSSPGDFLYLDPPWSRQWYVQGINFGELWEWLRQQKASWCLSIQRVRVPKDLYDKRDGDLFIKQQGKWDFEGVPKRCLVGGAN